MANAPIDTNELKQLIMMGRKCPMNMAYNPSPKGADLLIIHRHKDPDSLGRIAKREGEGPKIAKGCFEIKAKRLILTVDKALPGFTKNFRKYLKELGFSFKVEIFDSEGNLLEEEDKVVAAPAPVPPQAAEGKIPEGKSSIAPAELTDRLRALQRQIATLGMGSTPLKKAAVDIVKLIKSGDKLRASDALIKLEIAVAKALGASSENQAVAPERGQNPPNASLTALVARANSLKSVLEAGPGTTTRRSKQYLFSALKYLKNRDYNSAHDALNEAETALNSASDTQALNAPHNPLPEAKWTKTIVPLQAKVDAAMTAKSGDLDAINRAFDSALSQADAGKFDSALKSAVTTIKLLKEEAQSAAKARLAEAANSTPQNVVRYAESWLKWIETRNRMQAELLRVKIAIDAQARIIDGLAELAQNTGVLLDYLEELDTPLEGVLKALVETPDEAGRAKLKAEAATIIASYRDTLDTDFFKAVDDNGFTETSIRSTALSAVGGVEAALAT